MTYEDKPVARGNYVPPRDDDVRFNREMGPLHRWFVRRLGPLELSDRDPRSEGIWEGLMYGKGARNQIMFIRDELPNAVWFGDASYEQMPNGAMCRTRVIGEHCSKSCVLPVYEIPLLNAVLIARGNFHDWKVSYESPTHVVRWLVSPPVTEGSLHPVYFEGFPKGRIYAPYAPDARQWSAALPYGEPHLYLFVWLLVRSMVGCDGVAL